MDISQSIENIMDGRDYQRGSIERDGTRQRNSEKIQEEEIAISVGHLIMRHSTSRLQLPTNDYLDNGPDKQHWSQELSTKDCSLRSKRWHSLVVDLTQESTLR